MEFSHRHLRSLVFAAICLLLLSLLVTWHRYLLLTARTWSLASKSHHLKPAEINMLPTFDLASIDRQIKTSLASNNLPQLEKTYFKMITQNHSVCPHSVRIGNLNDGGWDVCISEPFNIQIDAGCTAFSFGINYVYGYDNVLATKYNCTVRMFDPTMTEVANGPIGTGRRQWFYKRGLAGHRFIRDGFQLDKLCSILDEFAGVGKTIDLLKIDIEKWEWESLETALSEGCLSRVKQLLFETHTALPAADALNLAEALTPNYAKYLHVWSGLLQLGFRMWKWHENPESFVYQSAGNEEVTVSCCFEHYMVNWKFVQFP